MKISKKLIIGFSLVILLAIIVGAVGILGMQKLHDSGVSMYEKQIIGLESLGKASVAYEDIRLSCREIVLHCSYDDLKSAHLAKQRYQNHLKEFEYWMNEAHQVAATDELVRFYDRIVTLFHDEYMPKVDTIVSKSLADVPDHRHDLEINVRLVSILRINERIENLMTGMMDLESALAKQTSSENNNLIRLLIEFQFLLLIIAIVIAVIVAVYITRGISRPISEAAEILHEVAIGNFEARVKGNYKGEFAIIKESVNTTALGIHSYLNDKLEAEHAAHESELAKGRAEAVTEAMISSIDYASRIQKDLLPESTTFEKAFADYFVIWNPRDIVGGDIYWMKNFAEGTVLCVCDCTGHGTPGALLTMLVVSTFEATINETNYQDTAEIIWNLEQRLVSVFNLNSRNRTKSKINDIQDGCDLAVLYIAKDGSVTTSSGRTHIFVCDGKEVRQFKGQRLSIGEGKIVCKQDVQVMKIDANPDNKFYIASDGLFDQIGGSPPRPFGYKRFKNIILTNHHEIQAIISDKVWDEFESYRGRQSRRDDFQLVTFKPQTGRVLHGGFI